jgi:hypothetical protein
MKRFPLLLALLAAAAAAGVCSEPPRQSCNSATRGQLWPEPANTDRAFARRAAQCGELRMCTKGLWRHRWERLSVHISQLSGDASAAAPGCEEFAGAGGAPPAARRESAVE